MKKLNYKNCIIVIITTILVFTIAISIINYIQYRNYTKNVNIVINEIVNNIQEQYPDVDINKIISMLNDENVSNENVLSQYGIDISKDSAILTNDLLYRNNVIMNLSIILIFSIIIIIVFVLYNKRQKSKIKEITNYIEQINNKNYALDIQDNNEDELSVLKNELYKITVMLKEQAENSAKDKINLKNSLEDISHQLKTPLTSITIMLDNILDSPDMDLQTRNEFIKDIYREIANIKFLVQNLLILSKFDANTITFNENEEKLEDIIEEAKQNVASICDLKNIQIILEGKEDAKTTCDLKWQVEALTNILKNCAEHSNNNTKINVLYSENNMYSEIVIKDEGSGIDQKDLKHIFERFYKGKNSDKDSIGIGLSLAKTIIEKDNGFITVDSELGKGTTFNIKYRKQ
mgnify:CR=1 FL=1